MQALDTFNTAVVSPIYYVMFTSLTIVASVIMFKVRYSMSTAVCKYIFITCTAVYLATDREHKIQ